MQRVLCLGEQQIPSQVESVAEGAGSVLVSEYKPIPDLDYLQVFH